MSALKSTMTESGQLLERIALKLLEDIEQRICAEGGIDIKDYKAVTGALKELRELQRDGENDETPGLVVRFAGDAEELAR